MTGRASRRKGSRAEREWAGICGGDRVPLSGAAGGRYSGDVIDGLGLTYEVKIRARGFGALYRYLEVQPGVGVTSVAPSQAVKEGTKQAPDVLALRMDKSPWLVCMTAERFFRLLTYAQQKGEGSTT